MIRVLIVDDSRTFRAVLRQILSTAPNVTVVGEAADGHEAVAKTFELKPDVVTMDVRMPGKDGLEAIGEIMTRSPVPIVVVSAEGGPANQEISFKALQLGAVEVLRKPSSTEPGRFDREAEAVRLAVRAVAGLKLVTRRSRSRTNLPAVSPASRGSPSAPPALTPAPASLPVYAPAPTLTPVAGSLPAYRTVGQAAAAGRSPSRVVGIAASTGGPPALARILAALPADLPAAVLVVQHIAQGFEAGLVHWLARETPLGVKIAEHGEPLLSGQVYLAAVGRHLGVLAGTVYLDDAPPIRGFRPSGTNLFHSLAREYGGSAVGLVLTGMGDDGAAGLKALRERGAPTIAQGPASAVVYGMPREAFECGAAAEQLELDDIAAALVRHVRAGR